MAVSNETNEDIAADRAAVLLGYSPLKDHQKTSIVQFLKGNDVFIVLPTGYGKTVCYTCLPYAFDYLYSKTSTDSSIILVVSPLNALIKDQVSSLCDRGVIAGFVDAESHQEVKNNVNKGFYNILFISPELLVVKWRNLCLSDIYQKRLVGFIVDEAHCVIKWGFTFREMFTRIGEIRSMMSSSVRVMALTATATSQLRVQVEDILGMNNPVRIIESPDKVNIRFSVVDIKAKKQEEIFKTILDNLAQYRTSFRRTIIYVKNKSDCFKLYTYFQVNLGNDFTEPPGASQRIPHCRLVDMFFKGTDPVVKSEIISNFTKPSCLRIIISTVAFGMGIDCSDVGMILHLGAPEDIEMYVQQVGRAGRDGKDCYAILLHSPKLLTNCSLQMLDYVKNDKICRRDVLLAGFEKYSHSLMNKGCKCCDFCTKICVCGSCTTTLNVSYDFMSFLFNVK